MHHRSRADASLGLQEGLDPGRTRTLARVAQLELLELLLVEPWSALERLDAWLEECLDLRLPGLVAQPRERVGQADPPRRRQPVRDLGEVDLDERVGRIAQPGVVVADVHEAERLAALELVGQRDRPRLL